MPPDNKKIAQDCHKRGTEASLKHNWDYAIEMFGKAVQFVPDSKLYRQMLRGSEQKKYNGNKSGARMATLKLTPLKGRLKKAKMQQDWETVDRLAEEGLLVNPWDAQLNADVGLACAERGFDEVAIFGYQEALEIDLTNKDYNRALAVLQEARGNYREAIECWRRIFQAEPLNSEARSKLTQLEASSTLERGGYEGAKSMREVTNAYDLDRPIKSNTQSDSAGPGVSAEQDLLHWIRKNPANPEGYMKLAEFYRRNNQFAKASDAYQKALDVSGGDYAIREQKEDIDLDILRHNLSLAKQAREANKDDQLAARNYKNLKRELLLQELEIKRARVERYPKDRKLKFDLGELLVKAELWQEAIPHFQGAVADTRYKLEAYVHLGQCFYEAGNIEVGLRQLEKAIPDIDSMDQSALFVKAHYLAGRFCEKTGRIDEAENHYNEVLAVDYGYLDTRARLERIQGDRPGGSRNKSDADDE